MKTILLLMPSQGTSPNGQSQSSLPTFILLIAMVVVFWLFMIRPQAKKAKKQKEFAKNLSKGQKVVTLSGIHGKIHSVNEDNTIDLEISVGSFLKIEKSSVSLELTEAINKTITSEKK